MLPVSTSGALELHYMLPVSTSGALELHYMLPVSANGAELRSCMRVEVAVLGSPSNNPTVSVAVKPVLNWANVCSPNILWTVR